MDPVWDALMGHLETRADYVRLFDRQRVRPDAWLKVEAQYALLHASPPVVRQVRADRQGCDVWFTTGDAECWLAARGLMTSYAGAGREVRQTIASVEELSRELDKLRGLATLSGGRPALLLVAFAFGPEPRERNEWQSQMLRFEAKGFTPVRRQAVDLGSQREGHVYLLA